MLFTSAPATTSSEAANILDALANSHSSVCGDLIHALDADLRQYCDQKGVFRDTLFVRPGLRIAVKTRYERYVGAFVLHCHILDHEDQGMMANVRILAPGETSTPHVHQ